MTRRRRRRVELEDYLGYLEEDLKRVREESEQAADTKTEPPRRGRKWAQM